MKIVTFIVFLLTSSLNAQWQWLNPYPNGEDFNSVCFISPSIGWIASSGGKLLKTTDGGNSWSEKPITNSLVTIKDISFFNNECGVAVGVLKFTGGTSGIIMRTLDGGENWTTNYYGEELNAISLYSNSMGYAVGKSAIYITSDGGDTWKFQSEEPFNLIDVSGYNQNIAFAVGSDRVLLKTTNGGIDWTSIPNSEDLWSICSIDSASIIAVGYQGIILKSTDLGLSWERIASNTYTNLISINFSTPQNGIIISDNGITLITTDGGYSWQLKNRIANSYFTSVYMLDKKKIIAVGSNGLTAYSKDGGINWSADYKPLLLQDDFLDALYLDQKSILVTGRNGIYKSTDKGNSWEILNISYPGILFKLFFSDSKNGLALGLDKTYNYNSSFIAKTSDGGDSWTINKTDSTKFRSISYLKNSEIAFMVTEKEYRGSLYKSTDRGNRWTLVNNTMLSYNIHFFNESFGIASGYQGVFRTTDGGISWENISGGSSDYMSFSEKGYGIIAVHDNSFMITSDYGDTWKSYGDMIENHILGVSMAGNGIVTIVRGCYNPGPIGGLIQFSSDAGNTWKYYQSRNDFTAVNFLDEKTGIVIGKNSSILSFCEEKLTPVETSENISVIPSGFSLSQCYPNPFNPSTKIEYSIELDSHASLIVYDFLGRQVDKIFDEFKTKGSYTLDYKPSGLPSGVYFYRLKSGNYCITKKMILLK